MPNITPHPQLRVRNNRIIRGYYNLLYMYQFSGMALLNSQGHKSSESRLNIHFASRIRNMPSHKVKSPSALTRRTFLCSSSAAPLLALFPLPVWAATSIFDVNSFMRLSEKQLG